MLVIVFSYADLQRNKI